MKRNKQLLKESWLPSEFRGSYSTSLVSSVANELNYDTAAAFAYVVDLLEFVNAHREAKIINDILDKQLNVNECNNGKNTSINKFNKIVKEEIEKEATINDWKNYLDVLNYTPIAVYQDKNGFTAVLKETPNKKYFTQIDKNNWVRLSYKDIDNELITNKKFKYAKIIK